VSEARRLRYVNQYAASMEPLRFDQRWARWQEKGARHDAPVDRAIAIRVSGTALRLIDVINDMAFEGSAALVGQAEPMASRLAALKRRASAAGVPVIYINDNFGQWRSDFRQTVAHWTSRSSPCRRVSQRLRGGPQRAGVNGFVPTSRIRGGAMSFAVWSFPQQSRLGRRRGGRFAPNTSNDTSLGTGLNAERTA
jgi:hypothetical protein